MAGSKAFFFEKEKQETFGSAVAESSAPAVLGRRGLLGVIAGSAVLACVPRARAADLDRFTVTVQGSGPDVIFVPGLTCSRDVWNPAVAALGGKYRVHLVQLAGFAGLPAGANAQGLVCAGTAEGLAAYITQQNLRKPAVVGHSMGGTIGLMLAERHPDMVGRLMVVDQLPDPAIVMAPPGAPRAEIEAIANGIGGNMERADAAAYRRNLLPTLNGMILTANARPEIEREAMTSDHKVAGHAMREMIETDLIPDLSKITAPTTVVYAWNKSEPYTAAQIDRLMHGVYAPVKGAKFVRIDDSAHFVFIDQPAKFQAALGAFLA